MGEQMAAFSDCWDKLRLPDEFPKLMDGREPREMTLREAGGGGRLWDVEVVLDGEGHMYLERGWEQFAGVHGLELGHLLVFSYDSDAVLTVKVFDMSMCCNFYQHDDAKKGSTKSIDSSRNSSSSAEIDIEDAPTSQFTVMLKECHLGVRQQQQQYLNMPPEFQTVHGCEERSKVLLQMPRKSWPMNLKHNIFLVLDLEIARWAVAEHARQANDGLQFKRVVSGMELVVQGRNYNLTIDTVNGDGMECVYIAQVLIEGFIRKHLHQR